MDCYCGSGKSYAECCQPLHQGSEAPNALSLMRSRYSAYALGNVDYILKTTHSKNPQNQTSLIAQKQQIKKFCNDTDFRELKILEFTEGDSESTVTFSVNLIQNGVDCSFTEKSEFKKENGRWKYLKGEIK